jgi:hypothetical protein
MFVFLSPFIFGVISVLHHKFMNLRLPLGVSKSNIAHTMVSGTLGGKLTRRSHFVTAYLSRGFNLRLTGGGLSE